MYESVKIGIIGGDMRQAAIARRLGDLGYETAVWGLPKEADIGKAVRCLDWKSALEKSKVVLLPLPASRDGVNINSPFAEEKLSLLRLTEALSIDTLLVGGKIDSETKNAAEMRKISIFDYSECEEFQIKNAIPSAEGAIEIAMRETDKTLFDSSVFVLGYGRIGKVLLPMLKTLCGEVFVAARKPHDRAFAEVFGGKSVPFFCQEFEFVLKRSDVIINTVPAMILSRKMLEKTNKNCVIIDLASGDGGVDYAAACDLEIKAIHALALPGKVAPVSAGNIICDTVISLLKEERGDMKI